MDFAKGLVKAYNTKWSYVNTFRVQMQFAPGIKQFIEWKDDIDERNINLNIISINTPNLSNSQIESYVGDQWKIHNGRDDLYRFTITFRDQDQMNYYRKFVAAYLFQKTNWFDDVKMRITLWKDADYQSESDKKLFDFEDCMIDAISQVQFSNDTETQIAEFSVEFKCAMPLIDVNFKKGST